MINVGTSSRTPKVAAIREVAAGLGFDGSTDNDDASSLVGLSPSCAMTCPSSTCMPNTH